MCVYVEGRVYARYLCMWVTIQAKEDIWCSGDGKAIELNSGPPKEHRVLLSIES